MDQRDRESGSNDEAEFIITIEYDEFITRFDLDEILGSIDRIIEFEYLDHLGPDFWILRQRILHFFPYWGRPKPDFTYIGIKSVEAGSITLGVFLGGAVLGYVAHRFKKGVDESLFAEELERSGILRGDIVGSLLKCINDWAERFVPKQRELGGRVKKITATQKERKSNEEHES